MFSRLSRTSSDGVLHAYASSVGYHHSGRSFVVAHWNLAAQDKRSCSTAQRPPAQPITPSSQDIIPPVNGAHVTIATGNDTIQQSPPK
jgi:hypothetical protein